MKRIHALAMGSLGLKTEKGCLLIIGFEGLRLLLRQRQAKVLKYASHRAARTSAEKPVISG